MFKSVVREAVVESAGGEYRTVTQVLSRLLNKQIGERDYGAVEVCHILHKLPMWQCPRGFVNLRTNGQRSLQRARDTGGEDGDENNIVSESDLSGTSLARKSFRLFRCTT